MKLTFLGTRAYIDARNERHQRHASMLVSYYGKSVMVDCGKDWQGEIESIAPQAIIITHAHPDHAWGLKQGTDRPVYATDASWETMESFGLDAPHLVEPREPVEIVGMTFEAFPVRHSTRAPAVGYRITAGRVAIFYVPDVAWIDDRSGALDGARVYIGDGSSVTRSMVRKPDDEIIGHVPIQTQLTWCRKEGVSRALFTHCGSDIVEGDEEARAAEIDEMASERGVEARIACDGLEIVLR